MKTLIVSQYFWPENFRINELASELSARGHDVTVLTGTPNYPDGVVFPEYLESPEKFKKLGNVDIVRVPMTARGSGVIRLLMNYISFAFSASTIGVFKLRRYKFDHVFVYEPSPVTVGIPALVIKWTRNVPILFWVQDLWPETLQAVGVLKSAKLLALVGQGVAFIYNQCDHILVQSKSFVDNVRNYSSDRKRISYFPNWAEDPPVDNYLPAVEIIKKDGQFDIIFAGNIGDAQDFGSILEAVFALRDVPSVHWYFVGDGRLAHWVKEEITRKAIGHRVTMLGRFPVERMASFYLQADALLVTLKKSNVFAMTIPSKVQSYLAAGVPILGMLDGEGSSVIVNAGAGLACAAGDYEGLAANVLKMAALPDCELLEMGQAGKNLYFKEFRKATLVDQLELWMDELRK